MWCEVKDLCHCFTHIFSVSALSAIKTNFSPGLDTPVKKKKKNQLTTDTWVSSPLIIISTNVPIQF